MPGHIRSDNGPEFIAVKVQQWLRDNRIKTINIDIGSPWQNGYIESFHSRFRDECLSREMLLNLREARVVIADWRQHYNRERPHSRLGYLSPDASYTVSEAPDKLFAGRNMLYCGLVDTEQVFNLVYTDPFQYTFVKRFAIGAYILNRAYQLVPEHCYVEGFTADSSALVNLSYLPKPRLRKLHESFVIADLSIGNIKANGIRLSSKELANCTIVEPGGK